MPNGFWTIRRPKRKPHISNLMYLKLKVGPNPQALGSRTLTCSLGSRYGGRLCCWSLRCVFVDAFGFSVVVHFWFFYLPGSQWNCSISTFNQWKSRLLVDLFITIMANNFPILNLSQSCQYWLAATSLLERFVYIDFLTSVHFVRQLR